MSYTVKPLSCDPTKLKGLSEKLINGLKREEISRR